MSYDYVAYVGRFEPFHNGHLGTLRCALGMAGRVIVLIGSAGAPRSQRSPWTAVERETMIRTALGPDARRVIFCHVVDHLYNEDAWQAAIRRHVEEAIAGDGQTPAGVMIALIDHDGTMTQWPVIDVPASTPTESELSKCLFSNDKETLNRLHAGVPPAVFDLIAGFKKTAAFAALADEYDHIVKYKAAWSVAPYPPIFTTVDAVIVHSGHLLLVQRGGQPGKGLWALPGGFVEQEETLLDAALRELQEETRIKLPAPVLKSRLKAQQVFDAPNRSQRGRTITYGFCFEITDGDLPPVRGSDDALRARWTPLTEVSHMRERMFEDHFCIIEHFLGVTW